jgi:hypothetical protein
MIGEPASMSAAGPENLDEPVMPEEARFRIDESTDRWLMKTPDGVIYGPVARHELDEWESEGRVSNQCLIQRDGQTHWQSALVIYPHLSGAAVIPPRSATSPRASVPQRAATGTRRRDSNALRRNNGPAVLAMGIVGIVLMPFPVFAMIAWAMGSSETRAMDRGEASREGGVLVNIGHYMGIFGTCVGVLICLSCCAIFGR